MDQITTSGKRTKRKSKKRTENSTKKIAIKDRVKHTPIIAMENGGLNKVITPVCAQQYESIIEKIDSLRATITNMDKKIDSVKTDVCDLTKSIAFISDGIKTLTNDMKEFTNEMKILKSKLENLNFQINKEKKRNNIFQDKLIQIESQSRLTHRWNPRIRS